VGSTPTPYQVSDYASTAADHRKASAKSRGWVVQYLNGEPHADYDYMRVHDVYELQHIEANLRGRYMLAGDINAGETSGWNHIGYHDPEGFMPIGGNGSSGPKFTGRFDGVGHRIEHLHINRQLADENSYIGLFGNVNGALVENLSIVDGYVGGMLMSAALWGLQRGLSFGMSPLAAWSVDRVISAALWGRRSTARSAMPTMRGKSMRARMSAVLWARGSALPFRMSGMQARSEAVEMGEMRSSAALREP
jgi:adhesin